MLCFIFFSFILLLLLIILFSTRVLLYPVHDSQCMNSWIRKYEETIQNVLAMKLSGRFPYMLDMIWCHECKNLVKEIIQVNVLTCEVFFSKKKEVRMLSLMFDVFFTTFIFLINKVSVKWLICQKTVLQFWASNIFFFVASFFFLKKASIHHFIHYMTLSSCRLMWTMKKKQWIIFYIYKTFKTQRCFVNASDAYMHVTSVCLFVVNSCCWCSF